MLNHFGESLMLSIFQKDGSKGIVLLFLTLLVVIGVQSCNQEPVNVEPPAIDSKENFEKSLKQSSEMFRIATRLSTSNVSRSISIQNLDKDMQEQLVKQYGQDASKVYQSIKKDEFGKIDNEKINEAIKILQWKVPMQRKIVELLLKSWEN